MANEDSRTHGIVTQAVTGGVALVAGSYWAVLAPREARALADALIDAANEAAGTDWRKYE